MDIYDGNDVAFDILKNPLDCPLDFISMEAVLGCTTVNTMPSEEFGDFLDREMERTRERREQSTE